MGEAGVAAGGEVVDELIRREARGGKGFGADGPDGGYPGEAGEFAPEVGEIEPEERCGGRGVDGGAMLAGEESGIADEESGVGGDEHGGGVSGEIEVGGVGSVEVLEEDADVGGGTAAGGVGCDGADELEGVAGGEVRGIFDEQKDAADFVERGDGAAGDDGERWGEGGDGDEAEVGGTGVELGCTEGG